MTRTTSSFINIWDSKLIWRMTISLFLVVLLVNATVTILSLTQFEKDRLFDLRELGLYSIIPALARADNDKPISDDAALLLRMATPILGLAYYDVTRVPKGKVGVDVVLTLDQDDHVKGVDFYDKDEKSYEVVYDPNELGVPFYIVAKLNAKKVESDVGRARLNQIFIVLLLSVFITLVLIITLTRWFLDPILYLYHRLVKAAKDPENPPEVIKEYQTGTEIGRAIAAADTLMSNNAESLKRIKALAASEVNRLAYYDTLTGLPNRASFIKTLEETLAASSDTLGRYAVLAMDVDHFKDINDTMGHSIGDEALKAFASRLVETLPKNAILGRLGADEFAVMLPLNGDSNEAERRAGDVIKAIRSKPITVMNEAFQIRCSIGIAACPEDADLPEDVLKCADIALNKAKADGRDRVRRYSREYSENIQKRFQILRDLRVALDLEELELYFQPQIDLKTGRLRGAEALTRWWKPSQTGSGHFVSPVDFIPVAEQSGLILPLGKWVLEQSCKTVKSWTEAGLGDLVIAINVSGYQFQQKDIVSTIEKVIAETQIKPQQLEIEVTESIFMEDTEHSIRVLRDIQALGISISIDDFGTGYSSLSYLQRFPMDKLKIDRSFIRHLDEQPDNLVLTKTIIALAKTMGLKVVAEGVESQAEEAILIREECDYVQGFRYSAPIPDVKFRRLAMEYTGELSYFD